MKFTEVYAQPPFPIWREKSVVFTSGSYDEIMRQY